MMQTPRHDTEAHRTNARVGGRWADPLDAVLSLGSDGAKVGAVLGIAAAIALHGAGAAQAYSIPIELQQWAGNVRAQAKLALGTTYDIEVEKEPPPPPPPEPPKEEPEPEKEPEPPKPVEAPKPPPKPTPKPPAKAAAPKEEPAPAAAQAGKVLTQEADPDEPVDLTGEGFVTGNAETFAGGVTAAGGTSKTAVYDPNARPDGVPGGKGKAPAPPVNPGPDRSRPAKPAEATWASCAFPPEADAEQIDFQLVTIMVTVRPDGTPQSVKVVNDPGRGFGRAARQCAMSKRFLPALDRSGAPILATTPPFTVRFQR